MLYEVITEEGLGFLINGARLVLTENRFPAGFRGGQFNQARGADGKHDRFAIVATDFTQQGLVHADIGNPQVARQP